MQVLEQYGPMAENLARNYTRSFLQGLGYLHENKISCVAPLLSLTRSRSRSLSLALSFSLSH